MNKQYTFALIIILSTPAFSAENATDCRREMIMTDGPLTDLDKSLTSCGYMEGLANLKGQKEAHQKVIYEKLSKQLSKKINQNSEETALLTNYFFSNGSDLSMNNGEVKKSCNLESLKGIETCGRKKHKGAFFEMKLNALTKSLNPLGKKSKFGDGLYGILADKYVKNMGIATLGNKESSLQCPLNGGVSPFILSSQLDELSAQDIINGATQPDAAFGAAFDSYAQLKFLKSAGKEAVAEFKKYVLEKSKNKSISAKDYIAKFFLREDIQKKYLAPSLAKQCKSINDNINRFLCEDLTELGSTDPEVSTKMFDGLDIGPIDDQFGVDKTNMETMTAYGLQCLAQERKKAPVDKYAPSEKVDVWYSDFTSNTRPEESSKSNDILVKNFCSLYSCSTEEAQSTPSCKNGRPILSSDISKIFGCELDPRSKKCVADTLKSIDYLAGIEKIKTSTGFDSGSLSSSPRAEDVKKAISILPDFAANYLGVEGTLNALGLPITIANVAKEDFKVRKLETAPPPYQPPTSPNRSEYASNNKVDSESNPVQNTAYLPSTPTGAVPFVPKSYPQETNSKRIEGIRGKNKDKIVDSEHWTDDIPDIAKKTNIDTAKKSESSKTNESENVVSDNSSFTKDQFEEYKRSVENELRANRNKISSVSSELARTQQELFNQRSEMERRFSDLERKQKEMKESSDPKVMAESKALKNEANTLKNEISRLNREPASAASGGGIIVTPEYLKTLNEEELQKRGVNVDESFVISIKIKDKAGKGDQLVNIPVIRHSSNGKSYLIPRYEGKNEEIIRAIEKSPLFYDFIKVVKAKVKSFASLRDLIKGK